MLEQKESSQEVNYLSSIIFALILVGYPVFAGLTALFEIENNVLSIIYRMIVISGAIVMVMSSLMHERLRVNVDILVGGCFLFYYFVIMFLEWSLNAQGSMLNWNEFWVFLIFVCFLPALPYVWRKNAPDENFTPTIIMLIGLTALALIFYSHLLLGELSVWEILFSGRLAVERLNPIALGHLGVSTAIVALWAIAIEKKINILTISSVIVGILGMVASGSRGPFLSLALCVLLVFTQLSQNKRKTLIVFVIVFILPALILLFFIGNPDNIYIFERVAHSMFEDTARNEIMSNAFDAFVDNMIIGAGYPFDTYPHNIILEAFMSSGVFGGIFMVVMLVIGITASLRLLKCKKFSWISLLFVQYLLFTQVSGSIYISNIFWMLWVCVVILNMNMSLSRARGNAGVYIK